VWSALSRPAHAHTADTSYLRATVSKHSLELRFTFDLATLYKIERLDKDGDGKVSRAEAESAAPSIASFLTQAVTLELNGEGAELGKSQPLGWPVDAGDFIEEKNYGQTLLHFTFRQDTANLIEDFYILYELYAQLGAAHRTIANIEQEGKNLEVVFTQFEPDYLYDTFWLPGGEPVVASTGNSFRSVFKRAADKVWYDLGFPVMMLAAFTLWPRKAPVLLALGFLIWYAWDFRSRMHDVAGWSPDPAEFPVAAALLGMLAAFVIGALIAYPVALPLKPLTNRRWFAMLAWVALVCGGLYVTAATQQARDFRPSNASERG
jgi:hypothetical protein